MGHKRKIFTMYWLGLLSFFCLVGGPQQSQASRGIAIKTKQGQEVGFYTGSYALLIGVSDYTEGWPDLNTIPGELAEVKQALIDQGFTVQNVLNPDSHELEEAFEDFIYQYGYDNNNRLLFFYSGHGYSRKQGKKGYLVPVDAPIPDKDLREFLRKSLDMTQILAWSRQMVAKHALFLFDSCFSGTIFQTKALPEHPPHITSITSRPVRQYISAGSAEDEVPANSVFAPSFVRALRGEADLTNDGYITGTELGLYLRDKVLYYETGQTPQYGKIKDPDWDEGDFVFLAGGRDVPTSQTAPAQPEAASGSLLIWTEPEGALVYLEGKRQGAAPVKVSGLKPDAYRVEARQEGYVTASLRARVRGGETSEVTLRLEPVKQTGRLYVNPSPSDARVRIMNIVPVYHDGIELDPGEYHIRVDRRGYATKDQWVDLQAGEKLDVEIALDEIPSTGRLTVRTTPSDARVRLLNIDKGYHDGLELEAGRYQVEVSRSGYETVRQWLSLSPGEEKQVRIGLEQAGPRPGEPWTEPETGMEFVWVPGGCYDMGCWSDLCNSDEKPVHEVCLDGFWMGKTEVIQGQWKQIMGINPSHFDRGSNYPVECVSWIDCQNFIKRLNRRSSGGKEFRLPTEAEWEYAARSGGETEVFAGGKDIGRVAWYRGNSDGRTHQVGTKSANGLGLYDMSGNVREWCQDVDDEEAYSRHSRHNPVITSGSSSRVIRGGCWFSEPWDVGSADRDGFGPGYAFNDLGFRLCFPQVR